MDDVRLYAVKAALWEMVASVKQAPGAIPGAPLYGTQPNVPALQASLRRILAGSPGYVTTPPLLGARLPGRSMPPGPRGGGIEPTSRESEVSVGTSAPTALNWARHENREQLRSMLGRRPTPEERRAGMQVRRQLARDAGQSFVAIRPDNYPPSFGGTDRFYPETMTNPQLRRRFDDASANLRESLGRVPTPAELRRYYQMIGAENLLWGGTHPIHSNANIRNPRLLNAEDWWLNPGEERLNLDPRRPERYNNTLPPQQRMSQQQMDVIRQQYYQQNPQLIPVQGQPGYEAWQRHLRRAEQYGTTKAAPRRSPADAMDTTLDRLRESLRQSGAAVGRARITPAQDAARKQRFRQGRTGFGDTRISAPPRLSRPLPLGWRDDSLGLDQERRDTEAEGVVEWDRQQGRRPFDFRLMRLGDSYRRLRRDSQDFESLLHPERLPENRRRR